MIVTCTSCSKRYLVDARALGASGRNVRCAGCGTTWFQAPPDDGPAPVDFAPPQPPEITIDNERRERRVQLPAVKRTRGRGQLVVWAIVVVLIVGAVWGLIAERTRVTTLWPPAAKLYAMVGYGPAEIGTGLQIRKQTSSRGTENGVPILAIDGEVVNTTTVARDVPKLRVALQDGTDHEIQHWIVSVTEQRLLPGASVAFHTTIAQPSEAAASAIISFAGPSD